jgi:putative spermidine/putrescine transport system permease protein
VIAGALFAFITSWDEVVTAIFLSSPLVRTLPVVMWTEVQNEVNPTIAAVASILTFVTILLFVSVLTARRLGSKKR